MTQTAPTKLQKEVMALNAAIDEFWNSDYGLRLTGMGEPFILKICNAQQRCKDALEAEGIPLGSNP